MGRKRTNSVLKKTGKKLILATIGLFQSLLTAFLPIIIGFILLVSVVSFVTGLLEGASKVFETSNTVMINRLSTGQYGEDDPVELATDTSWVRGLGDDFYEETYLTPESLLKLLECEKDSYTSEIKKFTVTYLEPVYSEVIVEVPEETENGSGDEDGNEQDPGKASNDNEKSEENEEPNSADTEEEERERIIVIVDGVEKVYEHTDDIEKEREFIFDIRKLTFDYRLPWEVTYAMALAMEKEDKVSIGTIARVYEAMKPEYEFIYDYYWNEKIKYTYGELTVLPHLGISNNYDPLAVPLHIKTYLADYYFNVERKQPMSSVDPTHVIKEVVVIDNFQRINEIILSLGGDEENLETFIELLYEMDNYSSIARNLALIYGIDL